MTKVKGILKKDEGPSRSVEALDLCWGNIDVYTFPVSSFSLGSMDVGEGVRRSVLLTLVCFPLASASYNRTSLGTTRPPLREPPLRLVGNTRAKML